MKKLFASICTLALVLTSCGGGSKSSDATTIENPKLYQEMLGGVYAIAGWGSHYNPSSGVSASPGDNGFLTELDSYNQELLILPFTTDPSEASGAKSMLSRAWGINSKEDFLKTANNLLEKGHSAKFTAGLELLKNNGGAEANISKLSLPKDLDRATLQYLKDNYARFEGHSMKSWDYARFVNNTNMAYSAGYVTEDEAHELLAKAVPLAQAAYDSWDAYYDDFLLGRELWSNGEKEPEYDKAVAIIKDKENKYNVYNYVPFK